MITTMAFFILLLCISSSGISAQSSSSSGSYTVPICAPDGYYCPGPTLGANYICLPSTQRCTGDADSDLCIRKSYQHCDYHSATGKFRVYRHASSLFSNRRRRIRVEHQFITYRGLMHEYGNYGARVQDPNDPNYEYNTRQELGSPYPVDMGLSSCTYQEVMEFARIWTADKYKLFTMNCQHFATGLGIFLIGECSNAVRRRKRQSDDDLAMYIFSIAGINCTEEFTIPDATPDATPDGSLSVYAPLSLVTFSTTIIIGVLALMQL